MYDHKEETTMATLVRWDPLREVAALQNEMGRFISLFRDANGGTTQQTWAPAMDVWETEGEIVYAFDLPGISEDKISVEFEDGTLSVSAERERSEETSDERFYRYERRFGSFTRTIGLPQGVSEEQINAEYKNGVLEIHVKKPEVQKPRRIQIGGGETATIEGKAEKA
jgi:HSP20 family protein